MDAQKLLVSGTPLKPRSVFAMNKNDACRKRKHRITLRLDDKEYSELCAWSCAAKKSMNDYIRELLNGSTPVAFPPADYQSILHELRRIGVNMNQLAGKANAYGFADEREYRGEVQRLWNVIAELATQMSRGGVKFGSNKDMGC